MRDFPIFTTEYGVSSLILREIPYRNEAYIRIRDHQSGMLAPHLEECVSFCRMAGAERIYAEGEGLEGYPVFTEILSLRGIAQADPDKTACLFPVTEKTVEQWRSIYNTSMRNVDTAQTLEKRDEKKILEKPGAYFVHDNGRLLGIGWLEDGRLLAVASVQKGAGERIMHTLMSLQEGQSLSLEVASTNEPALRLYRKLGLLPVSLQTRWHWVWGEGTETV